MYRPGRRAASIAAVTLFVSVALPIVAAPGSTTCALAPLLPLDPGPDGLFFDHALSPTDRRAGVAQVRAARRRISDLFGAPSARPLIVQLASPDALWPLMSSPLASTYFVGTRACVIIGPAGRDVDVTAHELVHAEIFHRAGSWQRQLQIPTWFDEGAAMQADHRTGFDLPPATPATVSSSIHSADSYRRFFNVPPIVLTRHFALAKLDVARWLARVGPRSFYKHLGELRRGRRFEGVWNEAHITQPPS